jgi:predicted MPP superfamily phosphohydrolase
VRRIVWLTDLHLNFLHYDDIEKFILRVAAAKPDVVLLGGDIAEATDLFKYLHQMARTLPVPIYFVLGNHDFYFSSIEKVRNEIRELTRETPNLVWLGDANPIELTPKTGLVGHDGWADARAGDYIRSMVMMYDYQLIEELAALNKEARWLRLKQLGDEAAAHIRRVLPVALERFPQVFVLTHVPPWREACWYQGQISNDEWLPHFTCLAMGEAIESIARDFPDRQLTVLCGHTHSAGVAHPLPNVTVLTGGAEYGAPDIQQVFELE